MTWKKLLVAALLSIGLAFALAPGAARAAMPVPAQDGVDSPIQQVYGGCGPYGHRGPWGGCRRGGQWSGYGYGWRPAYARPMWRRGPAWRARPYGGARRYWRRRAW